MRRLIVTIALLATAGPVAADDYPHIYLKNDKLKVKVYLPDAEKGFYRGTRFDHAGVFGEIAFAGHKIFGPWKDKHDPTNHDDIIGPCEEFGIEKPLGYDDAEVGGTFLKIGVGELEKPKEDKYSFAKKYKIVKPAEWKQLEIPKGSDSEGRYIAWKVDQKANGYGYHYTKALTIKDGTVLIAHILKNTGENPITTDFYNHNFFNVDGDAVGPNYSLSFDFNVKAKDLKGKFGDLVELKRTSLHFKEKLDDGFVMAGLTGFEALGGPIHEFGLHHGPSNINIGCLLINYPLTKFNVWGVKTTICPEPFLAINLKAGEKMEWTNSYTFSHNPPKK